MADKYDHKDIEQKWQNRWRESGIYKTEDNSSKPAVYVLDMFPYPSGEGLHVGHPKGYIATDIYSRFKRMNGFNVLHPMGWDAFGLPAENYALKHKVHPRVAVEKNIETFKQQLSHIGFDYDWDREINTTDPEFYKWTQWIFLQMFKKGLAFQSNEPINWCPGCLTGLANEDLDGDKCERCDSVVEKKKLPQWVLKITDYADRMLSDLDTLEWPEHIKEAQRNWIGRSEGAAIEFDTTTGDKIKVFTTRPDTLFGATYMVLAPEHELVEKLLPTVENATEVQEYVKKATIKSEIERAADGKEKTGVQLQGIMAINPANKEEIPVFVADYVLGGYGTGAIMAVPAHDERDFEFAKKYDLPIKQVTSPITGKSQENPEYRKSIVAIVHNPRANKYLTINWKEPKQTLFVGGGIDEGEDARDSAMREVCEESQCTNLKYISETSVIRHNYFAHSKNVAREIDAIGFLFELVDDAETDTSLEIDEDEKFEVKWKSAEEIESEIVDELHATVWSLLIKGHIYSGAGLLINSGKFDGMASEEAKEKITEFVGGKMTTTYKIKDWVFSRQRYWGEPIPIIHCEKCGAVAVPEDKLPVLLPEVESYEPSGTGESPLANITDWVNTTCPECGGAGKRETNTMPQWAGSSWYYLRFMDSKNVSALVSKENEKYWAPVDVYVGGDHAVRHLIYARFWHKFLFDIGSVSTEEPFARLEFLGFILAEDGKKMSKRFGNVIDPDDVVSEYGADAFRVYEMFMGPFENTVAWSTSSISGTARFIDRFYKMLEIAGDEKLELDTVINQTIKKVGSDIESFKFNTAVSQMMILLNAVEKEGGIGREQLGKCIRILSPFAPHIAEEMWERLGNMDSVHTQEWPKYDESKLVSDVITIAVQVNGKTRATVDVSNDADKDSIVSAAKEAAGKWLEGQEIQKEIVVPGRLVNFVI